MYRVFNMGVGFCVIVPDDPAAIAQVDNAARAHGIEAQVIGHVVDDPAKRVLLPERHLVGEGDTFTVA